jgi:hypothetical protein
VKNLPCMVDHHVTRRCVFLAAAWLSMAAAATAAELPPWRLDGLTAFPREAALAGPLEIDGDLAEWRDEAFVTLMQDPASRSLRSMRLAIAHDAEGLCLAGDVVDASPLENTVDPLGDPFRGWRGDSMQMRFETPEGKIAHCTWWNYSQGDVPALDIRYGRELSDAKTLTGEQAGLRYRRHDGGYSFELRLPWKLLGGQGRPGHDWKTVVEPHWNVFGDEVAAFADCVVREENAMYKRPQCWGRLRFVAAENAAAVLASQAKAESRRQALGGDGMPAWGAPVVLDVPADGFVSLAITDAEGRSVRTLLAKHRLPQGKFTARWDGLDDSGQPAPPGRYRSKALVHAGIEPKFVAGVHNSGTPSWITGDGTGSWGGDHGDPVGVAIGPEDQAFLLWTVEEAGFGIIGVDREGRKQWGSRMPFGTGHAVAVAYDDGKVVIAKEKGLLCYDATTGARATFPNGAAEIPATAWPDAGGPLAGVAAGPQAVYVSLPKPGLVLALDKKTFAPVRRWSLPTATALAHDATAQRLLAIADGRVWSIDPDGDAEPAVVVERGLEAPAGIAVDAAGSIYVSQRGQKMCVGVFDPQGRPRRTIGKPGGRPPAGRFDSAGMFAPAGLAVDGAGRLWVTEEDKMPRRISLWNAADGTFVRDFFGASAYAVMMAADPDKPEHVYLHNCRFVVDYDQGTWRPDAMVFRAGLRGPTIPGSEAGYGFMGTTFQVARYEGRTFAYNGSGGVFAWDENEFKPLLAIGHGGGVWKDSNGDGLIDEGETRTVKGVPFDNNIFQFGGSFFPGAAFIKGRRIYRPQGLTPDGAPNYPRPEDAPPILTGAGPMTRYSNWMDVWPSREHDWEQFYAIASLRDTKHGGIPDGGGEDGIYRFTRDGTILWRYPRVRVFYAIKDQRLAGPGDLMGAVRIAGIVEMPPAQGGEIIAIGCYRGYFGLVSGDGLFIDTISDDKGKGLPPGFDTFFIENFSGWFFKHPKTGRAYLFCGDVDGRILEIGGLDTIRRFDGEAFELTAAVVADLAANREKENAGEQADTGPWIAPSVAAAPGPDLETFPAAAVRTIDLEKGRAARVGICHDARRLYAIFDVDDSTPWINGGTDWTLPFKGGDAVDVQLGTAAGAPLVRVFVAPAAGDEPLVVGMWPTVPAGLERAPQTYQSPVGREEYARVAKLATAETQVVKRAGGYTALVSIPWADLGLTPPTPGATMRADLGVLFSDPSGSRTIRRRYLHNAETAIVDDVPSEVRLTPQRWGEIIWR